MSARWDEHGPGGHPSREIDRGAWAAELARIAPEADRAAARRLEADAAAARVAERARTVRFWAGSAVGLVATGALLLWSLRTGG